MTYVPHHIKQRNELVSITPAFHRAASVSSHDVYSLRLVSVLLKLYRSSVHNSGLFPLSKRRNHQDEVLANKSPVTGSVCCSHSYVIYLYTSTRPIIRTVKLYQSFMQTEMIIIKVWTVESYKHYHFWWFRAWPQSLPQYYRQRCQVLSVRAVSHVKMLADI